MTEQDDRTYIRVHDGMPEHWKVEDLSDGAFRQLVTIWCWCARQRTDGFVPQRKWLRFGSESDRTELIEAGLMEPVDNGVQCHDYLKHQRSRDAIRARSDASRIANHARWHVKRKRFDPACDLCRQGDPDPADPSGPSDSDSDSDSGRNPIPPNGCPTESQIRSEESRGETGVAVVDTGTGSQSVRTHARVNEALRWLRQTYGLTDSEAAAAWGTAEARSRDPINSPVKYLKAMAEKGHLADIVGAIQDAAEARARPAPAAVVEYSVQRYAIRDCRRCDHNGLTHGDAPRRCDHQESPQEPVAPLIAVPGRRATTPALSEAPRAAQLPMLATVSDPREHSGRDENDLPAVDLRAQARADAERATAKTKARQERAAI